MQFGIDGFEHGYHLDIDADDHGSDRIDGGGKNRASQHGAAQEEVQGDGQQDRKAEGPEDGPVARSKAMTVRLVSLDRDGRKYNLQ